MATTTLFGFSIQQDDDERIKERQKTFALPANEDGAVTIQSGAYYGTYVDLDGVVRNEIELISRYRGMAMQPELETAIDDIVNEAIVMDDTNQPVSLNMDELEQPQSIKNKIQEEFDYILSLLNFSNMGHDVFRRWYIDGRLFYHIVIDEKRPGDGIQEIRYIDPRRIRKIREIQKTKDPQSGIDIIRREVEYYLYNDKGMMGAHSNLGSKIAVDSVVNVNSGLMDAKRSMVLSYLHKAIKPLNNLRMMEDATVIYRLSRAPERRIFYVDVGQMSTIKAEQYLRDIMVKYRNKLVYDSTTGEIKDDRKHLSMLEDFWLPRREGSRGTEITTLPGGQNLGEMEDVKYFEKKLYKSLGIPVSRLEENQGFTLGRATEITRDELKFTKFVHRLRNKFATLFDDLLRVQLSLKNICSAEEWKEFKEDIYFDFLKDNNFNELKEAELLRNRFELMQMADPFVGRYVSVEWAHKNILMFTDEDIKEIVEQMATENQAQAQAEQDQMAAQQDADFQAQQAQLPQDQFGNPIQPGQPPALPGQQQAPQQVNGAEQNPEAKRRARFASNMMELVQE